MGFDIIRHQWYVMTCDTLRGYGIQCMTWQKTLCYSVIWCGMLWSETILSIYAHTIDIVCIYTLCAILWYTLYITYYILHTISYVTYTIYCILHTMYHTCMYLYDISICSIYIYIYIYISWLFFREPWS